MTQFMFLTRSLAFVLAISGGAQAAGIYDPQAGTTGSLAIPAASSLFTEWASTVASFHRGPQNISVANSPLASFGVAANALGVPDSSLVSLGDGGSITLAFTAPIANGPGADFAVFENGFVSGSGAFLELGFVDVSSDGVNFVRFPGVSLTQTTSQINGISGLLDATNLNNLAGKYIAGFGTGFDLSELAGVSPFLDVNHIIDVRITDVVGSIDPQFGTRDSLGNLINDPWPSPSASDGFDLDAVGVIHTTTAVPEPAGWLLSLIGSGVVGIVGGSRMIRVARGASATAARW